ncbi:hypothetical protein ZWY2020_009943 [Hordeum vulgare]|nr:hypothetical protein ZWY2020_009943 [Hordeum vulgare]
MATLTSDLLRPVHEAQALDEAALLRYAAAHVPGFPASAPSLALMQFGHGQSNPTYCLEASAPGGEPRRYVLRKKPAGAILQSAHAVEREFQVLKALGAYTDVPVPKFVNLLVYLVDKRRNIYLAAAKTLAAVHKIDATAVGLHKYGRRDNYCKRQDRVIGVLDWELSTLGNQMCDVAYSCMPYIIDGALSENSSYGGFEHSGIPDGIPQLEEYLAVYCSMSGNASGGERARFAGKAGNVMVDCAWDYINRENVLRAHPATGMHVSKAPQQGFHVEQEDSSLTSGQGKFVPSEKVMKLRHKIMKFMKDHIYPKEDELYKHAQSTSRWTIHPEEENLKALAKEEGLWNLFIPLDSAARARKVLLEDRSYVSAGSSNDLLLGAGLTNLEYGYLCEIMGRSVWAPQIFNCGAPDTGNMEVLLRYGTKEQQKQWLVPLLEGKIRSGFAMTEPQVASSDATNIECSISRQGDFYVINGRKWWTSGAMDPRCKILILMGKTDFSAPKHKQQSMILVDINTPGVQIKRPLLVFGFDDAPHGHAEIIFDNVRVRSQISSSEKGVVSRLLKED